MAQTKIIRHEQQAQQRQHAGAGQQAQLQILSQGVSKTSELVQTYRSASQQQQQQQQQRRQQRQQYKQRQQHQRCRIN